MKVVSRVNKNIPINCCNVISGKYDLYSHGADLVKDREYSSEKCNEDLWIKIYITDDVYICIMYYERDTFFYTDIELRKIKLERLGNI